MSNPEQDPTPDPTPDPSAPGTPLRQDAASDATPTDAAGGDQEAADSVEDQHGGTVREPGASSRPHGDPLQQENAETSLDQPSDGAA